MKRKHQKKQDPIIYLKIFLFVVSILIVFSLSLRSLNLLTTRKFNTYSFNILLLSNNSAKLVHIDSDEEVLSIVGIDRVKGQDTEKVRVKTELSYQVPIDAVVVRKNDTMLSDFLAFKNIVGIILNPASAKFSGLNSLDIFKAYIVSKSINNSNKTIIDLRGKSKEDARKFLKELVNEEALLNEKTSVEIVNGTSVLGLGTSVAQMLEASGFDVVVITSGKSQKKSKFIKRISDNETTKRLSRIFGLSPDEKEIPAVADVTIVLGEDYAKKLN